MTATIALELFLSGVLLVAGAFSLIAAWGFWRLPSSLCRLHVPTVISTVGVGGVLLAAMLWPLLSGDSPGWHELLLAVFVFITAPVSAHLLGHALLRRHRWHHAAPARPEAREFEAAGVAEE